MNLQSIYIANGIGVALLAFLSMSRYRTRGERPFTERLFSVMIWLAMIGCILEAVTFGVDGLPGRFFYIVSFYGNTILYAINGIGCYIWCVYVDLKIHGDIKRVKKIYPKMLILVVPVLLSLVVNIFGKYYFYVDENNIYHRSSLVMVFYIYLGLCMVQSLFTVYLSKAGMRKMVFFPIWMYLLPIIIGSAIQSIVYGVSLAWVGTAIGLVSLHTSLQTELVYMDELTQLFNRAYLKQTLYRIAESGREDYYGIMVDMDHFKAINDTYGHSVGDQALRDAADILKESVNDEGFVYRLAGDEFFIMIKTGDEEKVEEIEKNIENNIDEFLQTNKRPYQLSMSLGHTGYVHGEDDDRFLARTDMAMYAVKEKHHRQDG